MQRVSARFLVVTCAVLSESGARFNRKLKMDYFITFVTENLTADTCY